MKSFLICTICYENEDTDIIYFILIILTGCGVSKSSFSPNKKYSLQQVQKDYSVYQYYSGRTSSQPLLVHQQRQYGLLF